MKINTKTEYYGHKLILNFCSEDCRTKYQNIQIKKRLKEFLDKRTGLEGKRKRKRKNTRILDSQIVWIKEMAFKGQETEQKCTTNIYKKVVKLSYYETVINY